MNRHKTVKQAILTVAMMAPVLLLTGCLTAGADGHYDIMGYLMQPTSLVVIGVLVVAYLMFFKRKK